ncbi:glycosyltransferase family 2 protein [Lysobacter enzymogenes]|uniref:glycosyltransferase family 2 protein n=1 Tax=Lysobacter enzymogenes TaxID=69 RepID=UPI0008956D06|nr:glycosyltransferase family 2 protein [Lysobacter enzymogenes]SDW34881.1 Glycosyltransferase, GT2 family [Lysobacter enzymogenes]
MFATRTYALNAQLRLTPIHQLRSLPARAPTGYVAQGEDPQFEVGSAQGELPPPGWYVLDLRFELEEGRILAPCLYPDFGAGVSEALRIGLAEPGDDGRSRSVVLIGSRLHRLRFDPSEHLAQFAVREFRLRRVSRMRAVWELLCGIQRARREVLCEEAVGAGLRFLRAALRGRIGEGGKTLLQHYRRALRQGAHSYQHWLARYDRAAAAESAAAKSPAAERAPSEPALPEPVASASVPTISIVLPVRDPPLPWLRRCLDSVLAQTWPHWQLCIADDASRSGAVRRLLREYAARDPRIALCLRDNHGHICEASNSAIELAQGSHLAFLDHDDELAPQALAEVARAIAEHPRARLFYSDEDKIDESGRRFEPNFKPAWNPDLLRAQNYICHFVAIDAALVRELGGLRPGYEGAQDHDLLLRCAERLDDAQIVHIPRVLYHWRVLPESTALSGGAKPYALEAGRRAIEEHYGRTGVRARVEVTEHGYYRSVRGLSERPLASLIVPTRDRVGLLRTCVESVLQRTAYRPLELLVVDNGSSEPETLRYLDELRQREHVRVLTWPHPFNFSAIVNFAAAQARGEVLCLLNNDTEVIASDWLDELVSHAVREDVGAVGGMLYYPNDTIQHAGVILGIGGVAGHAHGHLRRASNGYLGRAGVVQNLSAVTGACLALRRTLFAEIGGMDETLAVAFNDVDLCLRLHARGYRNVWTPHAELYHHESASRGPEDTPEKRERFLAESAAMQRRWGDLLANDPAYNPNLSLESLHFDLAFPPRSRASRALGAILPPNAIPVNA